MSSKYVVIPMRTIIYLDGKAILLYVLVVQYISISARGLYICLEKRVENLFFERKVVFKFFKNLTRIEYRFR